MYRCFTFDNIKIEDNATANELDCEHVTTPPHLDTPAAQSSTTPVSPRATFPSGDWVSAAMTVWGWTFDVLLIILFFASAATDIFVARELWFEGAGELLRERMQNQLPRFIQYPVMLILSPVVPVLNWLLEILKPQVNVTNSVARWSNTFGIERFEFTTGVAAQEIGSMQISVFVMERLDVGFCEMQKRPFGLLY